MKVYQLQHYEIFINEQLFNEERFIKQYKDLLEEMLRINVICNGKYFQSINISSGNVSSNPNIIEALLRKTDLPAFKFIICKN